MSISFDIFNIYL